MIGQGVLLLFLICGTMLAGCAAEGNEVERLPATVVLASVSEVISPSGGVVALPGLASVSIPVDAFPSSTLVNLSAVRVEGVEFRVRYLDSPIAPMPGVHHIRVTTAGVFNSGLQLMIRLPNTRTGEISALVFVHKKSAGEDVVTAIRTSPAPLCDNGQAVCVNLSPDWFLPLQSTGQQVVYVGITDEIASRATARKI